MKLSNVTKAESIIERRRDLMEMQEGLARTLLLDGDDITFEISGNTEYLDPSIASDKLLLDAIGVYLKANIAEQEAELKALGVEIDDEQKAAA